jgi:hypothetical protein
MILRIRWLAVSATTALPFPSTAMKRGAFMKAKASKTKEEASETKAQTG